MPPSKPCREMEGLEFAMQVLANFDLDIVQKGIYANQYISYPSTGLNTLMTFFNEEQLQDLDLEALVWSDRSSCGWTPKSTTTTCTCSWRPMSEVEKQLKRMDTKARVKKYVARC